MMQRITGAVLQRTFTVERCHDDAGRSILYFDVEGTTNPTTHEEQVTWNATQEAWQLLLKVLHGTMENLSADWVCNSVRLDILLPIESVYDLLRKAECIVDLMAPNVPTAA